MFRTAIKAPNVEFLCHKEDLGVIPPPYPARKLLPQWYKDLPPRNPEGKLESGTIKRCAPFLDAMVVGWIIPLAADVEFTVNADASGLSYRSLHYREMVQSHKATQVAGHPETPKPPMKWLNWWLIRVPKDYSLLFVPPLNRPDPRFECLSGMVDGGYFEFVNFPFFFTQPNYTGIVKQGTPLVQVIPIHRSLLMDQHEVGPLTPADTESLAQTRRQRSAHESLYRDKIWSRK